MNTPKEKLELFNDLTSKGYEAAKSFGEINIRLMERMINRQLDTFNIVMDSGLRNIKMITEAKGPNDLFRGQMDLIREVSEKLLIESRESLKITSEVRDEYRTWFEQSVQNITTKMSQSRPIA
ncbi:hypothetical protein TI05_09260 [Achromatium sp. WMS3]|nr:hypothetical protein TI05_09260 [Achromatium sp. WMS3]